MSDIREFQYGGKSVKITVGRTVRGKYIGIPNIEGIDLSGKGIGRESDTAEEALDEGERMAKEMVDAAGQ